MHALGKREKGKGQAVTSTQEGKSNSRGASQQGGGEEDELGDGKSKLWGGGIPKEHAKTKKVGSSLGLRVGGAIIFLN